MTDAMSHETSVSFIIVARNAAACLGALLADYAAQDYPVERRELIIVDGMSEDNTRAVVARFRDEHDDLAVRVLDNPRLILATGWNIGLAESRGDILIRVDAHARIAPDFITRNVQRIDAGEDICGGQRVSRRPEGVWGRVLHLVETSRFGGGSAGFRNPGDARYVDTLAHAAYRREVFAKVGGLDERLRRNQDNEIHRRMTQAGYKFYFDPAIRSSHTPRATLAGLLRQKFGNGVWMGILLGIRPRSCRPRHLAPLAFVLGVVGGLCLLPISPLFLAAVACPYVLLDVVFTVQAVSRAKGWVRTLTPIVVLIFPAMHAAYGIGTFLGLLRMPVFRLRTPGYGPPFPVASR